MTKTTKELARELGFLCKRSTTSQSRYEKQTKARQLFRYLIILDFESTCWENGKGWNQEIIEFPAVLLNTHTGEIKSEFHCYVQPQEHPVLSRFCSELTGIKQEQVDQGIPLSICLKKFNRWLKEISEKYSFAYNTTTADVQPRCAFVTWSDWDLGVCLHYEMRRKQLRKPPELNAWIDLRATYREFYARKPKGLKGALQDLGMQFKGREHSGIEDARNTAHLAYRMICDGCVLNITKTMTWSEAARRASRNATTFSYINQQQRTLTNHPATNLSSDKKTLHNPSAGETTRGQSSQCTNRQVSLNNSETLVSNKVGVLVENLGSLADDIKNKQCLGYVEDNCDIRDVERNPSKRQDTEAASPVKCSDFKSRKMDELSSDVFNSESDIVTEAAGVVNTTMKRNILYKREYNRVDIYSDFTRPKKVKTCGASSGGQHVSDGDGSFIPSCGGSDAGQRQKVTSFGLKDITNVNLNLNSLKASARSGRHGSHKTPSMASFVNHTRMKPTPPMCDCGRRAKRKVTQKPGPNVGRVFFCCGSGRKQSECCTFFKWETPQCAIGMSPMLASHDIKTPSESVQPPEKGIGPLPQPDFDTPWALHDNK